MSSIRTALLAGALAIGALAGPSAIAGYTYVEPVVISGDSAYGSLYDARHSSDSLQYIECTFASYASSDTAWCIARDAAGSYLNCTAADADQREVIRSLGGNGSMVWFRRDPSTGFCAAVEIVHSSAYID